MSNPHPDPDATRTGTIASQRGARQRREDRFEDARYLMSCGVHPDRIAARLGTTRDALSRQAYRWGANDIGSHMQPIRKRAACVECGDDAAPWTRTGKCRECWTIARLARGWMVAA